jgi:adenylate cyclase, class 2
MPWEVEQKFPVSDLLATEAQLKQLGATFSELVEQADCYFNHPSRDFGQTDEALRLRQVGSRNWITYKGPKIDATTKTRRELELPLPDGPETPQQFASLLSALGFRAVATVRKVRRPGTLQWDGQKVELALDQVDSVGPFLELEVMAEDNEIQTAKAVLQFLSQKLRLPVSERRSYLELLLSRKL